MIIDLVSVQPLAAIQLIYAAKTQGLEFSTVWIVGARVPEHGLLAEYAAVGNFELAYVASHDDPDFIEQLRRRRVDLLLQIGSVLIRRGLRAATRLGVLNLHAGLLPRYRGLDSALWAVLEAAPHGVSAHFLDAGVDTGPLVLTREVPTTGADNAAALLTHTHNTAKWQVFAEAAIGLRDGTFSPRPQQVSDGRQYFGMHQRLAALVDELLAAGKDSDDSARD